MTEINARWRELAPHPGIKFRSPVKPPQVDARHYNARVHRRITVSCAKRLSAALTVTSQSINHRSGAECACLFDNDHPDAAHLASVKRRSDKSIIEVSPFDDNYMCHVSVQ